MSKQEQIDLIAEEAMGWHKEKTQVSVNLLYIFWVDGNGRDIILVKDFNPYTNIQQAIEVLEKYCKDKNYEWRLEGDGDNHSCSIFSGSISIVDKWWNDSLSELICLALIEAIGGKG